MYKCTRIFLKGAMDKEIGLRITEIKLLPHPLLMILDSDIKFLQKL